MVRRTTYTGETAQVDLSLRAFDELLTARNSRADDDRMPSEPSLSETVMYLLERTDAEMYFKQYHLYLGRIEGVLARYRDDPREFDLDEWNELSDTPAIHVVFSSGAHDWQAEFDEESKRYELAEEASPADLSLVVFEDGRVLFGGTKEVHIAEMDDSDLERVESFVQKARDRRETALDSVYELWETDETTDGSADH